MDLLQLLMQQLGGYGGDFSRINYEHVIERYTNKKFLFEAHGASLRSRENLPSDMTGLTAFQTTSTTFRRKSLPSVPLHRNNCITLKDLLKSIDEPVVGKFLLCRSLCPPVKFTALFTIVDDPVGELGVRISLYNFVRNASHARPKEVYEYLPVNTVLAIMNPWFKKTTDGGLTVRCDNPAEVVILDQSMVKEIFGCLTWTAQIPMKYRQKELLPDGGKVVAKDWKVTGNQYFAQKRYSDAIQAYTNGINDEKKSGKLKLDLLANRSATYLALHKYTPGLIDAESVLIVDDVHIKCIFRKTKALFGLTQYRNALTFLRDVPLRTLPNGHQKIIKDLTVKAKSFIVQSEAGEYPWIAIFQNQFDELADFVGPVIVKNTSTKGRGLFATEAIKAGQLILANKAFARIVGDGSKDFFVNLHLDQKPDRKYVSDRIQTQLVTEIAHILKESPEKCPEVYNLYAGPEFASRNELIDSSDHCSGIDIERIERICFYNQFGQGGFGCFNDEQERDCGLWLSPSYINHSCVDANSTWFTKGNFLFVFAFHDIAKNEEILISYAPPIEQKQLVQSKHFACDCRLCIRDMQDNSTVQSKRSNLISRMDAILKKYGDHDDIIPYHFKHDDRELTMILESLHDLRKDAPELDLCYVDKMELLAGLYFRNGQILKSISTLEKVYSLMANIPAFCQLTASVSSNIVGGYVVLGQMNKIKEWTRVLKRISVLAHGSWKVIEIAFPLTYKSIQALGISLNEI